MSGSTDPGRERGSVVAEIAVVLSAVAVLLLLVLGVSAASALKVRLVDAARTAARLASAGHEDAEVVAAARRLAGEEAQVSVGRESPWVEVEVRRRAPLGLDLTAVASAWAEPALVGAP